MPSTVVSRSPLIYVIDVQDVLLNAKARAPEIPWAIDNNNYYLIKIIIEGG